MSRRLVLVVAVLALAVPPAVGPGLADPGPTDASRPAARSAGVLTEVNLTPTVDGTTLSTPTLSTPTLSTPTLTTTDDLLGDGTVDETTDELDDTVGVVEDETSALAGTLSGAVSTDGALEVDGLGSVEADLVGTAGLDEDDTTTTASGAADDGSTPVAGAAGSDPGAGAGGVPVDPLVGGALLGGAVVTVGLVARQLATGAATPGLADTLAGVRTQARLRAAETVAGWRDRIGPLVAPFGYQRYDDSDPLEHAGRARLYEHVRDRPGTHLAALGDAADLPLSTARYHLRILEHEGLVRSEKRAGRRRFLPPDVDSDALAAALADDATATVLRSLVEDGPSSVSELAERLDRDPSTVSHHLARLANDGLVDRERRGRAVVSSVTPSVEVALRRDGLAERAPNPANA